MSPRNSIKRSLSVVARGILHLPEVPSRCILYYNYPLVDTKRSDDHGRTPRRRKTWLRTQAAARAGDLTSLLCKSRPKLLPQRGALAGALSSDAVAPPLELKGPGGSRLVTRPSRSMHPRVSGSSLGESFVRLWRRFAPDISTNGRGPRQRLLSSRRSQFPSLSKSPGTRRTRPRR